MHRAEPEQLDSNGAQQGQELQHLERCLVEATSSHSCFPRTLCLEKRVGISQKCLILDPR